ncbi:L,D-transpeptidase [Conexibacter woesei]|uniref:ErfK/YbiS/YcfS/YnhG family protein n=1 Tax=Conexibacter woesei (strain DSM 14684 / CCUG 47730 / CIP 108061 / JCM 11494 / NBRC 100937 / ID131577) TaxID=469383 RepID=D3F1Q8_CONWI|nr:L,D-transpeptidase [Conexibacter woesei]ADB54089.1 ErfK/YbiS/YcfS/YnhG family protein [Conexibacter woesei DSM 14684]
MSGRRRTRGPALAAVLLVALGMSAVADAPAAVPAGPALGAPADPARAVARRGRPGARIALPAPSRARGAWVAKVLRPAAMRERPAAGRRFWTARTATLHSRGAMRLMVLAARYDRHGRPWLLVDAPLRPNARAGWIAARDVRLSRTRWYLSVSTGRRELRVYSDGTLRRRARLVVGAPATPTPQGLFAVYEITRQADPDAFVGPYAMHLTALSEVLEDFGGGPGRVALHGRGPASLVDPLGSARSHGCLRADNAVVDWLRTRTRPGTPIRIGP